MALTKTKKNFGSAEAWNLFREAGYVKPTRIQQRLVPLILTGKDVAVEAEGDSGKTAAFILPVLMKLKRGRAGIKAVVLTSSTENSRKTFREFRRFIRSGSKHSIFAFGFEGLEKKEHRILARNPDVVIGTPNKIIDHIRRGNLDFSNLQTVVIDSGKNIEHPGFVEDILFIFSKLTQKKQTILVSSNLERDSESLTSLLKRPTVVPISSWRQVDASVRNFFTETTDKQAAVVELIFAQSMESLLVQCSGAGEVKQTYKKLQKLNLGAVYLLDTLTNQQQNKVCQTFSVGKARILVCTYEAGCKKNLRWVTHVINFSLPPNPESYKPRSFVLQQVTTLAAAEEYNQLKEMIKVQIEKKNLPSEGEVFRGAISQIIKQIKEQEDPEELNHYRGIIRKNVPLTMRSYFSAYLFKESFAEKKKKTSKSVKLFMSMGKNRKVFPRDLIQLFQNRLGAKRSQIHEIKVLDNYSFVEVDASLAERAITELSGLEFKGRSLTVNYARRRESHRSR
jgi:ATP-dependent RNA helicase DeaD